LSSTRLGEGVANHLIHRDNARLLEQISRETSGDVQEERRRLQVGSVADPRGVPIIGPGCGRGAIRGTLPGDGLR
jgi:hypothetical protein